MITDNKFYQEETVFKAENLLREAKRQKALVDANIPEICLLDPDGDLLEYLQRLHKVVLNKCWACYHSKLYTFVFNNVEIGIIPCVVGASYAVLVAEQLFVSGCRLLISVTSAGIINDEALTKKFILITSAIRDEGTSYHYLPPEIPCRIAENLLTRIERIDDKDIPYQCGKSWTTDAPYRETASAIEAMKREEVVCVEMEAAALYAVAQAKQYDIICFAHLTNTMAQSSGDFEKGEESGSIVVLNLLSYIISRLQPTTRS